MYGAAGTDELVAEEAPLRPLTAYAESKVRAEEALSDLADDDFAPVFMRNATAYGARRAFGSTSSSTTWPAWAYTTGKAMIMSDGSPWRPLVHVQDIARAAARRPHAPRRPRRGRGVQRRRQQRELPASATSPRSFATRFPDCEIEYAEGAGPDPRSYRVDFGKFARTLPEATPTWTAETALKSCSTRSRQPGWRSATSTSTRDSPA